MRRAALAVVPLLIIGLVGPATPAAASMPASSAESTAAAAPPSKVVAAKLTKAVGVGGILLHEAVLQFIADRSGDTRTSGTRGFDLSAAYVKVWLTLAGYKVKE